MMVMLFLFYFAQFDHAIDERANTKGLFLIYSHYPLPYFYLIVYGDCFYGIFG
ncbi:hypothetical protein GCWU000342_02291 [Shuttleworthella satelles DSM 14600]|uniref:Uncharacterized protein n=1 Tax=Shuttleworthella satelles DSM 14600 TaxID=626523 RepID=C4GDW7_9FIRM|nr:hypothetical protein GCWU000342_02291 [Shuttleworthia satelles DSM 14600]